MHKPKIKISYKIETFDGQVTATDKEIDKAMESIGYVFYGCGYNMETQERDLGYEIKTDVDVEKCACGNLANEEHTCPYNEDINNDSITLCNCCDDCIDECSGDI